MLQQIDSFWRHFERTAKYQRTDRIGAEDYRNERQKRVVNECSGVDRNLVKAKQKGQHGGQYCVETEERRESDKNPDGKSERRPLWWIVNSKQTAKTGSKHM